MNTLDVSKLDDIQRVHAKLFVHYRYLLEKTDDWNFTKRELSKEYLMQFCKVAVERIMRQELSQDKM